MKAFGPYEVSFAKKLEHNPCLRVLKVAFFITLLMSYFSFLSNLKNPQKAL